MEFPSYVDLAGLATAIGQAAEGVVITDLDGAIRYVNTAYSRITGYRPEEVLGRTHRLFKSGKHSPAFYAELWGTIRAGNTWSGEVVNRRKDKTTYTEKMSITPVRGADGAVAGFLAVKEDVTLLREAERTQRLLASIVESSADAIISLTPEGMIASWNKAAERIYGYSAEEALGRALSLLESPDECGELWRAVEQLTRAGRHTQFQTIHRSKTGESIHTSLTAAALHDSEGCPVGISVILRDITLQRRAEEALRTTASRYRRLVESNMVGVVIGDATGRVLEANEAFLNMHGYTAEDLRTGAVSWKAIAAPLGDDLEKCILRELDEKGRLTPIEVEHVRKDGVRMRALVGLANLEEAACGTSIGLVLDVTRAKRAEAALRASERRLQAIVHSLDDMVIEVDRDGNLLAIYGSNTTLFSPPGQPLSGRNGADVVGEEFMRPVIETVREVLRTGQSIVRERSREVNGEQRWYQGRYSPIRSEDGSCQSVCLLVRDITGRKREEDELRHAKEAAERASHAKDELLSRVSHELRTPLNTILGFAQLLDMDEANSQQKENLGRILRAGHHLLRLVNEVLEISRIESGRLQLDLEPVCCGEALAMAVEMIRPLADAKQLALVLPEAECAGTRVIADRQRLVQALLNLLSNAVKYTHPGGRVTVECGPGEAGRVRMAVADTGIGIPAALLERLFEPFQRLGAERTSVEGTGLGLSLSRGLVELMNGSIQVESVEGKGSTFAICLPAAQPAAAEVAATHEGWRGVSSATVLYIEDDATSISLVQQILKHRPGTRLITATHGTLGLEMARQYRPDLVLLDLYLLDIAGAELMRELQQDARTSRIPIVTVTSDESPSSRQRLLDAGARAYLTKPLDARAFLATVDQFVAKEVIQ